MQANIKRYAMRWTGALLCALLLVGTLTANVLAASATTVSATLSPDITVKVDGVTQTFFTVSGTQVHPVLYNGTTYLPVRAIGELMGKNVNWDQNTLTVTLSGRRTTAATTGARDVNPQQQTIQAELRPDFTIIVDGATRTFTDANGSRVYPVLYQGSTYLPVRAIGELMGKSVNWDGVTRTVTLSASSSGGGLVTDADSFDPTPTTPSPVTPSPVTPTPQPGTTENSSYIGVERAKSIALAHAGLTSGQVTFVKAKLEFDDGRWEYEIEFISGNYQEYDYEIDARTGAILKYDYEVESWAPPSQNTNGTQIGIERAKSIALNHAGLSASQVRFVKARLDFDDGRWEYEIEFISGAWEYEFEIDAYSGAILSYERDSIYD